MTSVSTSYYRALLYKNGFSSINSNSNLSIGVNSSSINISGDNTYINDKLITLNRDGSATSGFYSGIEIEENKSITGYLKTNSSRNKWLIKAPLTAEAEIFTSAGGDISGPTTFYSAVTGMTTFNIQQSVDAGIVKQTGFVLIPSGSIMCFAGATSPDGWLLCDGTAISRESFASLFNAIGTTYGSGNGSTTFNLPNFKGRVPVGRDAAQTEFNNMGETGGEKTHTLTIAEMPSHDHGGSTSTNGAHTHNIQLGSVDDSNFSNVPSQKPPSDGPVINQYYSTESAGNHNHSISSQGGGQAHNVLQPYIVVQYIIKY